MSQQQNYYDILQVPRQATPDQIRSRYRELARRLHPDVAGAQGQAVFQQVTRAYEVLQDSQRRAQYDGTLSQVAPPVRRPAGQAKPPAAVLRSPAMHRLLSEAEGDAFAEAGQTAEALASYRSALGQASNPPLEAKIARLEARTVGHGGGGLSPAPVYAAVQAQEDAQPFWRRWLK